MIHILDSDLHGMDSIQNFIDDGKINHLPCPTFAAFCGHVMALIPQLHSELVAGGDPLVVVDTVSALAHIARMDHKLGIGGENVWDQRGMYFNTNGEDKAYLTSYNFSTDGITRMTKMISAVEATFNDKGVHQKSPPSPLPKGWTRRTPRMVLVCHEADQEDATAGYKKRAPLVNKALYASLKANSSDMFRLTTATSNVYVADGSTNADGTQKILYKKGARLLWLRETEDSVGKYQVQRAFSDDVPDVIVNPNMRKICVLLHKKPSRMVIYGPEGTGKTTLAVSELEFDGDLLRPVKKKEKPTQVNESKEAA